MASRAPQYDPYEEADGEEGAASRPSPMQLARYLLWAAYRRRILAGGVFLGGLALSVGIYAMRTPQYKVETRILAQRQRELPSAVRPTSVDDATRSASELVHRRDNLIALIKQTHLFEEARAKAQSERRWFRWSSGADEDPLTAMVLELDKALSVTTGEGTITISIEWPDKQQAYHLVEAALENFFEARHLQEITALDEVISLLQGRLVALRDQVERESRRPVPQAGVREARRPPAGPGGSSEEMARLGAMLEAKERAIRDVEEFRRRRLADLQAQLDEKRGIYSDAYPSVISLRRDIEALSRESPQISALRDEEKSLRQQYTARLAESQGTSAALIAGTRASGGSGSLAADAGRDRDVRTQYQQMVDRVTSAQAELDAARAGFKYRYSVIWPAQMPKKPSSPNPFKVIGLGSLVALLLALLASAAPEVRAGRIMERWQVERTLELPVLAELGRR